MAGYPNLSACIPKKELREEVRHMGVEIATDYEGLYLTLIIVLQGAMRFGSRLIGAIDRPPVQIVPVMASSYHGTDSEDFQLDLLKLKRSHVQGQHVLICDDILDSGQTLWKLMEKVKTWEPKSLRTAVLLRKKGRQQAQYSIEPDYVGFHAEFGFVVGFGLDYRGWFRNLSYVAELTPDARTVIDGWVAPGGSRTSDQPRRVGRSAARAGLNRPR